MQQKRRFEHEDSRKTKIPLVKTLSSNQYLCGMIQAKWCKQIKNVNIEK